MNKRKFNNIYSFIYLCFQSVSSVKNKDTVQYIYTFYSKKFAL